MEKPILVMACDRQQFEHWLRRQIKRKQDRNKYFFPTHADMILGKEFRGVRYVGQWWYHQDKVVLEELITKMKNAGQIGDMNE